MEPLDKLQPALCALNALVCHARYGLAIGYYSAWLVRILMALTSPVGAVEPLPSAQAALCMPAARLARMRTTSILGPKRLRQPKPHSTTRNKSTQPTPRVPTR